jgi:hypothetical protein
MPPRRSTAAAVAALAAIAAFTVFRPSSTSGPIERDFEAYYAAGVTVDAGGDPYSRAIWDAERNVPGVDAARDELLPFVGPAASLPLWLVLGRLPYPAAAALWSAALLAALAAIVAVALRVAGAPADRSLYAIAGAFALCSAPAIGALALGQAALLAAAGVAAAVGAYRDRRIAAACAATLLAALQPNLALVLVARLRSRWDAAVAACAAAFFAGLTLAAGGGVRGFLAYLGRLGEHRAAERGIAIQHTPAAIAYAFGLPAGAISAFDAAAALLAVAAAVAIVIRERLDATTATLVAAALIPLAAPFFHEPDFVIELLPVLILAVRARGRARTLAGIAAVLLFVDWFGLAQRTGAQGQIVCLGLVVAAGFAGVRGTSVPLRRPDLAGFVALAAVAVVAVPLALNDPAPTWPDGLPPAFAADPRADISDVWADEGRAAGLTVRDPVWGALRAIPLAGCVVLTAALVTDARRRRRKRDQLPAGERRPAERGQMSTSGVWTDVEVWREVRCRRSSCRRTA